MKNKLLDILAYSIVGAGLLALAGLIVIMFSNEILRLAIISTIGILGGVFGLSWGVDRISNIKWRKK